MEKTGPVETVYAVRFSTSPTDEEDIICMARTLERKLSSPNASQKSNDSWTCTVEPILQTSLPLIAARLEGRYETGSRDDGERDHYRKIDRG